MHCVILWVDPCDHESNQPRWWRSRTILTHLGWLSKEPWCLLLLTSPFFTHPLVFRIVCSLVSNYFEDCCCPGFFIRFPVWILGTNVPQLVILSSRSMIGIPSGARETHFKEFPRHIHANKILSPSVRTEHLVNLIRRRNSSLFIYKPPVFAYIVSVRPNQ